MDNQRATPLFFQPLKHGVDLSIQAATKYIGGHADVMLGYVSANDRHAARLHQLHGDLGLYASGDDCFLGLRGLRTLAVRLARHQETGLTLARWLQGRPEIARILHPGLESDPGHVLWKRSEEHTSELQSPDHLVCRLLLEKKKQHPRIAIAKPRFHLYPEGFRSARFIALWGEDCTLPSRLAMFSI